MSWFNVLLTTVDGDSEVNSDEDLVGVRVEGDLDDDRMEVSGDDEIGWVGVVGPS